MKRVCCIGHITLDKIVTPDTTTYLNGGTAYYFAHGMAQLPNADFQIVTALAPSEMSAVEAMRAKGIDVCVLPSAKTVYFENIYGSNQDHRTQRVLAKANPFRIDDIINVKADFYHLGSLLADDFSVDFVRYLSTKGIVSLDVQGYLRRVEGESVVTTDWEEKCDCLKYVDILKVNDHEMAVLTGETDVLAAARKLAAWGVREVIITEGSLGSSIYAEGRLIDIHAYPPLRIVDATGCGDTYMTGYLYKRAAGASYHEAACFAAAMSTLKLEAFGAFSKSYQDICRVIDFREVDMKIQ